MSWNLLGQFGLGCLRLHRGLMSAKGLGAKFNFDHWHLFGRVASTIQGFAYASIERGERSTLSSSSANPYMASTDWLKVCTLKRVCCLKKSASISLIMLQILSQWLVLLIPTLKSSLHLHNLAHRRSLDHPSLRHRHPLPPLHSLPRFSRYLQQR